MLRKKIIPVLLILMVVMFAAWQISPAMAAAGTDEVTPTPTPAPAITGTVQTVTLNKDAAGVVTSVSVTVLDAAGETRTVDLSLDAATALGLVSLDASGAVQVNPASIGTQITIEPGTVIVPPGVITADANPVGDAIAAFFGIEPAEVATFHADGAGYGVIAQACWISYRIAGDASLCGDILDAKASGAGSTISLPDGSTVTYDNWGQFKKTFAGPKGSHQNLGGIISGHTDPILPGVTPTITPVPSSTPDPANGQDQNYPAGPGSQGGSNGNHGNHGGNGAGGPNNGHSGGNGHHK